MSWNHRVIYHDRGEDKGYEYFGIHECFYEKRDDKIPNIWTEKAIAVIEEDLPSLRVTLARMIRACKQPTLVIRGKKLKELKPRKKRSKK